MTSTRLAILFCALFWLRAFPSAISGAIIAEWNFNSPVEDLDAATGTTSVSLGDGAFTVIGEVASTFGSVGGGATSDPAISDNSQVRLRSFPGADTGNKTAGVEFTINTSGYEKIAVAWDQYNSATASRHWRMQYTRDGFQWIDHEVVSNAIASKWTRFVVSFADISAVNDRPYLGIRLVQEFESSATGFGVDQYVAVGEGNSYSRAGTCWLDMVSITGRVIGSTNELPTILSIADLVVDEGDSIGEIALQVSDLETPAEQLMVAANSYAPGIATAEIQVADGENQIVVNGLSSGEAVITVRVTDEEGDFAETSFSVVVRATETSSPTNFFLLWDFNTVTEDADPATGSFEPVIGSGQFQVLGTDNFNFGTVSQGATSDPVAADNSMLRIASFPLQGAGDLSTGIEFFGSTAGFRDVAFVWDQYNSGSASRYWRVQITTNGTDFLDFTTVTNTSSRWRRALRVHLNGVSGVENNPNFGIRFVATFGVEEGVYVPVSAANYSSAGTLWLDMIGLSGEVISNEEPPAQLSIHPGEGPRQIQISWPSAAKDYELESKSAGNEWNSVESGITEENEEFRIMVEALDDRRLFRLKKKPGL